MKEASASKFLWIKSVLISCVNRWRPVSRHNGKAFTWNVDRLMDIYDEISSGHDVTLVEGAGGLMVPLLPSYTYADFARVLRLPVIVVAANRLG